VVEKAVERGRLNKRWLAQFIKIPLFQNGYKNRQHKHCNLHFNVSKNNFNDSFNKSVRVLRFILHIETR